MLASGELEIEYQDWSAHYRNPTFQTVNFREGNYYTPQNNSNTSFNLPNVLLMHMHSQEIILQEVWYRFPDNNCDEFDVMVQECMIIKTVHELSRGKMKKFGLKPLQYITTRDPHKLITDRIPCGCPNAVKHFIFKTE